MKRRLTIAIAITVLTPILYWLSLGPLYYCKLRWGTTNWETHVKWNEYWSAYTTPSSWLDYRWRWYADTTETYIGWFEELAIRDALQ